MRAALRPRYTFAEYLEIERRSREVKHEYVSGETFAVIGGSVEHSALATAVLGLLFAHYQQLDSLREYVLVAQDRRRVEVWARDQAGWIHAVYQAGSEAPLPSIDYALHVDALYDAAGVC